jgi:hypothetical protein
LSLTVVLCPVATEYLPRLTIWFFVLFPLGFGLGSSVVREAVTATTDFPWVATCAVTVIGPEHLVPGVPPRQIRVSDSIGPDDELAPMDAPVVASVVRVWSPLVIVPSPLEAITVK